jgi:cytochrome c oxidase subunit 1
MVASIGAFISFASTLWFIFVIFHTFLAGKKAANNPWGEGARTLEWTLPSPPAFHTYEEIPQIAPSGGH